MSHRSDSGEPTEYTDADALALTDYLYRLGRLPDRATFMAGARVEWNGSTDKAGGGYRTVMLEDVRLQRVRELLEQGPGRAKSYKATTFGDQVRQLGRTARGRAALTAVNPRRAGAWLKGGGANVENRRRVAEAYEQVALEAGRRSSAARAEHARAVADAFSDALADAYAAEIRLFDLDRLDLL